MSLEYLAARVKAGLWTFSKLVFNANRDLPFDDFKRDDLNAIPRTYVVGNNQIGGIGDQKKRFISKSTLIYVESDAYVIFNNTNNVQHILRAGVWYEFKHNIYQLTYYLVIGSEEVLIDMHFEGVMVDEARRPE